MAAVPFPEKMDPFDRTDDSSGDTLRGVLGDLDDSGTQNRLPIEMADATWTRLDNWCLNRCRLGCGCQIGGDCHPSCGGENNGK